ncbi:DsbC/DsbD-like thiol-disulfide interchange protein [Microvirga lupini]|uniref:DsbC/DsbD-like thiol-disulfide interchange protein n=1 Tax=Microvirga lupini TaxID=420324 RepID=A0A7W4VKL2_9HYPH|nr:protein-disulfide reductase DsbD domain-containing protein [Microvirga lupini]MBB3018918.1 DsbC/DsbD-like thiol-disulfide interchange protein [Microvirga lupini]
MASMFRAASVAFFCILSIAVADAQPIKPSASTQGFHSRARLIGGGQQGEHWLAGIEITLDQGFKTYWRTPGDSGLPPRFDWSGSENVASTEIRWPAPKRHEDAAGVAYVYGKQAVIPVLVKPKDPTKPIRLVLALEYGVCKDICIPANADLTLDLSGADSERKAIEAALAKVPLLQKLGAQADLSILSIAPVAGDKPAFTVTIQAPPGTKPALFPEGPENWFFSASHPAEGDRFTVTIEEKPKDVSGPVPLHLTLVAGDKAVETEVSLDENGKPR